MKNFLLALLTFLILTFPNIARALYDPPEFPNNKFGIHILNTSELESASQLVNSSGGDWGYVTIPIQSQDRSKDKWQRFLDQCQQLHIIPILRITTFPSGGTWSDAQDADLAQFANFLNELDWPIENRYIIIFNEVNRGQEWGGAVEPEKYARILKNANTIFKSRNADFFILPAALDLALPSSNDSLSAKLYFNRMKSELPDVWSYIDGWNSHSYPNPAFSSSPYKTGWLSIVGYQSELPHATDRDLPVFITETGWDQTLFSSYTLNNYYNIALDIWNQDTDLVAVTPFLFDARDGDFTKFSFLQLDGSPSSSYLSFQNYAKTTGQPRPASDAQPNYVSNSRLKLFTDNPLFSPTRFLLQLENFIRQIFGLHRIGTLTINGVSLNVELATTNNQITNGLSNRASLAEDSGMLFTFDTTHIPRFWMKDMQFPIDMIWIKNNLIIDITSDVPISSEEPPPTYSPSSPIDMVLEVNSGFSAQHNLQVGDRIGLND